jgi:hypothetical protein
VLFFGQNPLRLRNGESLMRLYIFFLFFFVGNNIVYSFDLLQDDNDCFITLTLEELADVIKTKKIYDPQCVGLPLDVWVSDSLNMHLLVFFHLQQIEELFAKTRNDLFTFEWDEKDTYIIDETKRNDHFINRRLSFAKECIRLQNFFVDVIDNDCWTINPFLKAGRINTSVPVLGMETLHNEERLNAVKRFGELLVNNINKELPIELKPEYDKLKERFDAENKMLKVAQHKWLQEKLEYDVQSGLLRLQIKMLNEMHALLVELFSLEPRADEKFLELIKDSKYPEKKKVKLLMELGIPYDSYRVWESQDGLFKKLMPNMCLLIA